MDAWYPRANRRPVPNTASPHPGEGQYLYEVAGPKTGAWLGWILHVVVGNNSPFGTFVTAKSPSRRFSHLWFAKDGRIEQYGPFTYKSWAQGDGNGQYISCETEGFTNEPLTDAQIQALAAFHVWTGLPDSLATAPGQPGIGTHYMGGAAWGGHNCPDATPGAGPRSHQRADILARAKQLRTGDDDMTTDDSVRAIVKAELTAALSGSLTNLVERVWAAHGSNTTAWQALLAAAAPTPTADAIAAAVAAKFQALPAGTATVDDATIAKVAAKVADEFATRLVR